MGLSGSSVKDFLVTCCITPGAVGKKILLNILGGLFKLSFFIFLERLHKVGVVMTEDWTQPLSDLFRL